MICKTFYIKCEYKYLDITQHICDYMLNSITPVKSLKGVLILMYKYIKCWVLFTYIMITLIKYKKQNICLHLQVRYGIINSIIKGYYVYKLDSSNFCKIKAVEELKNELIDTSVISKMKPVAIRN